MFLTFKKEYKPLIREGRKTQTVRVWKKCRLRVGMVVFSPGLGRLRIDDIAEMKLSELTYKDAKQDGFNSKAQFLKAIRKLYKIGDAKGTMCFRIRFKFLGTSGGPAGKERLSNKVSARAGRKSKKRAASSDTNASSACKKKCAKPRKDARAESGKRVKSQKQSRLFRPL